MTSISLHSKSEKLIHAMGPWLYGIPAFIVISTGLLWFLARLASWVFAVLKAAK